MILCSIKVNGEGREGEGGGEGGGGGEERRGKGGR